MKIIPPPFCKQAITSLCIFSLWYSSMSNSMAAWNFSIFTLEFTMPMSGTSIKLVLFHLVSVQCGKQHFSEHGLLIVPYFKKLNCKLDIELGNFLVHSHAAGLYFLFKGMLSGIQFSQCITNNQEDNSRTTIHILLVQLSLTRDSIWRKLPCGQHNVPEVERCIIDFAE